MTSFITFVVVLVALPVIWQIPRTVWPVRLNASMTAFTGLYRRYSLTTFTGYASNVRTWETTRTTGSVSAQTFGTTNSGTFNSTTTVRDTRRRFTARHVGFVLTDQNGTTLEFDAANTGAAMDVGHVVSAARLVHNGKSGNTFLVYNHTTNLVYVESSRQGSDAVKRGVVKMVFRLPTAYVVLLCLGIVTIPLIALLGIGAQIILRIFRKHGVRPLADSLQSRSANFPPSAFKTVEAPTHEAATDIATQIKELSTLHESGALSDSEFLAAKSKILGT